MVQTIGDWGKCANASQLDEEGPRWASGVAPQAKLRGGEIERWG